MVRNASAGKPPLLQLQLQNLGRVEEDQIPYLKTAYSKRKPRLVWDDEEGKE